MRVRALAELTLMNAAIGVAIYMVAVLVRPEKF